jgi:hypothetical protein
MNPSRCGFLASIVADARAVLGISAGELRVGCPKHRVAFLELRDASTNALDETGHVGTWGQR